MKQFLFYLMISQILMAQTEIQSYEIIQKISEVEIRFYPPVMMAKHTSVKQGSGFGKLFGYISGNNTENRKINPRGGLIGAGPVSYTHLTQPTTPYV